MTMLATRSRTVSSSGEISPVLVDGLDRRIILATQAGLPCVPRPFHCIAQQVGTTAEDVMSRLQRMMADGVIRRIGAVPNHYKLGYRANGMTVWDVPDDKVSALGRKVGALQFVSHCYHRPRHQPDWPYNLFAMVHAETREQAMKLVEQIASLLADDCRDHDVLFSNRILKKTGIRIPESR